MKFAIAMTICVTFVLMSIAVIIASMMFGAEILAQGMPGDTWIVAVACLLNIGAYGSAAGYTLVLMKRECDK